MCHYPNEMSGYVLVLMFALKLASITPSATSVHGPCCALLGWPVSSRLRALGLA